MGCSGTLKCFITETHRVIIVWHCATLVTVALVSQTVTWDSIII